MKVIIYICISLLILFLIYLKLWNNNIEGFENLGYLYGSWIGKEIPVTSISKLSNGSKIYMAQDGPYVKMVTDKGEARYFKGPISRVNPNIWNTYPSAGDGYKYNPNLGYLYGSWIGKNINVTSVGRLSNGSNVYMAQDGPFVKMVTDNGEARYFKGNISGVNPNIWKTYPSAGDGYKYKAPFIKASSTDTVSPLIQLKVPSKNNLCMDDGGVTKAGEAPMHLYTCDQNNKNQQFIYDATIRQLKNPNKNNLCVDDGGATTAGGTKMWMYTCDPNNKNQQFVYDSNTKMFKNPNKNNLCIDDGGVGANDSSGKVKMQLWNCDSNNANQKFVPVPIITSNKSGVCPTGYTGPESNGICKAGWSNKCGEDCAKNNCAIGGGKWIPLDYNKHPYTCQIKMPTLKNRTITHNKDGLINTGLQCYLDSTRKESAQGQVWKDISGKGRDFKWNKTPLLFNGKYCTKGNVALGPDGDSFGLDDGSKGYSIILYSKTNSLTQGHAFLVADNNSAYGLNSHIPWTDSTVYFDQGWSKNASNIATNRIQKTVGPCSSYSVWAFVRDSDNSMKIYKDGALLVSNSSNSADALELKASPWQIAVNMDADISKFMVYNTYFTASDVANVTKWIFADEIKQKVARMTEASKLVPDMLPVKLGLQLYLDASNYTIGSKEWKDQSGNGYDFTWNKAPVIQNNSFLLEGEYALSNKGSKLLNIDDRDTYTICWTSKTNRLSQNSVFKLKGNHLDNRGIFCHPTWIDNNMYFDQAGCCDPDKQRVYTSVAKYSNKYTFYSIRKTSKERAIFINGKKVVSIPTGGDPLNINLDKMIIGRDLEYDYTWFANLKNFMVYNRDLSDNEINSLHSKFFSKYNFVKGGHKAAELLCKKKGKKLCKLDDYCIDGKLINNLEESDKWGAYPDGWVQLGKNGDVCKTLKQKCQTSNTGICSGKFDDKEVAVLCCDIKYTPLVINAIFIEPNNKHTFFKATKYQSISPNNTSKVNDVKDFKGLTSNFISGNIDAISISNKPNVTIWLKGKYVMIYDNIKKTGIEKTINSYFHNLPMDFKDGNIDAIATRGPSTECILFKHTRYCIIDMMTNNFISTGNIKDKYSNLPNDFKMGFIDCAVYSRENCSYLMKNDKLVEYNFSTNSIMKGPINIIDVWTTLLPPFLPENKVCGVYEKLMKSDTNKQYWEKKYYKECKRITKKEYDTNLNNYKLLVDKYRDEYMKEEDDRKKMEIELGKYEKLLNDKKTEMSDLEKKLQLIKNIPCKNDASCSDKSVKKQICKGKNNINTGKKQIIVYEKPSIVEPPKFYEVNSQEINTCMPYDMNKYIKKSLVPKQKTAADFNIQNHPDYSKYTQIN